MLDLKYYCVATLEYDWLLKAMRNVWSVVPVTWLSSKKEFLVYPNPTYKAGEKLPCDWKPKIYKRHAHPQTSWLEYDIVAILNLDKPGNYVLQIIANIVLLLVRYIKLIFLTSQLIIQSDMQSLLKQQRQLQMDRHK